MAKNVNSIVISMNLEVSVVGRQPSILNVLDLYFSVSHKDSPGGFFSPIPGIAFHSNFHPVLPMVPKL
jgi:hypothetical protein